LARWQTEHVASLLRASWPEIQIETVVIDTRGDRILDSPLPLVGGKGLFTAELEEALFSGAIDLAVHSLKDVPTEQADGLLVGAIPPRVDPADVLVSRRGYTLATLPHGATIGTSSRRRSAQLLQHRPDLKMLDIRGNLGTRLNKALAADGPYDAIVLAYAGLHRLDLADALSERLAFDAMLPAPGQGALAVQCRDEPSARALLAPLNHAETAHAVIAERAFLQGLGGGCSTPIAAHATVQPERLVLHGRVSALDGSRQVDRSSSVRLSDDPERNLAIVHTAGFDLAREMLAVGADKLLEVSL
jgi:hydroxymethylbilane synthase